MKTYQRPADMPVRAIGYGRVSTEDQAESGLGLDAQRAAVEAEAARRGWQLVAYMEDRGASGKDLDRPAIQCVLRELREHNADVLVVSKLDRLSRSMADWGDLIERRSKAEGWSIVATDLGIDTTSPVGEMSANMLAVNNRYVRRIIGERTREALQAKKAKGGRLGRRERVAPGVVQRIRAARTAGQTLQAIADELTAEGVRGSQGGSRWYPSTVRAVLAAADADDAARQARQG